MMEDQKPDLEVESLHGVEKAIPKTETVAVLGYQEEKALMRRIDWQYEILFIPDLRNPTDMHLAFFQSCSVPTCFSFSTRLR